MTRETHANTDPIDQRLSRLMTAPPPPDVAARVRERVAHSVAHDRPPEVMTLAEVADYLRVSVDDLEDVAETLPMFEIAGRVRVRRDRLLEWVARRERDHERARMQSRVYRIVLSQTG